MEFTDAELEAYLDSTLAPQRADELEEMVRADADLLKRLAQVNARRNAGIHTLGEIWRRNQIGVPTKEEMRQHLLGTLSAEESSYIEFRIKELKCVFTLALLHDLNAEANDSPEKSRNRRKKIYDQGASLLPKKNK